MVFIDLYLEGATCQLNNKKSYPAAAVDSNHSMDDNSILLRTVPSHAMPVLIKHDG